MKPNRPLPMRMQRRDWRGDKPYYFSALVTDNKAAEMPDHVWLYMWDGHNNLFKVSEVDPHKVKASCFNYDEWVISYGGLWTRKRNDEYAASVFLHYIDKEIEHLMDQIDKKQKMKDTIRTILYKKGNYET